MHPRKILERFSTLLFAITILSCAGQVPPGGGPVDAIPPTITKTVPDTNSVRVKDNSIELEFSEYVDRRSVEESIFISPYVGTLEFEWGTTDVRVTFSQPLKERTTYVVNVGTDVVDLRAKNRMAAGFTLAFSTGDSIDQGFIGGRVFDEKPEGVMVFAYALANYNPDTLDPAKVKPDYIMQTGKNGIFALSNIALGPYRIIAVRDEYRNLLYDKQVDQYGVTVGDTVVTPAQPRVSDLWFRLSQEDTSKPFLTSAQPLTDRHLKVRFSEPLDSISFEKATFTIVDTLHLKFVGLLLSSRSKMIPSTVDMILESRLDSGVAYRVTAAGVYDLSGNLLDSANASFVFEGNAKLDTVRAIPVVKGITDSLRGVLLDRVFDIEFSEPVVRSALVNAISLRDSARRIVPSTMNWSGSSDLQLIPVAPLRSKEWYEISVVMDSVQDYAGNKWKDSIWSVHFESLDLRTTGTVEGVAMDGRKNTAGPIYVTAMSVSASPAYEKTLRLPSPGSFTMEHLPEGTYTFKGFRDTDTSGVYSYGRPFPFVPSERFIVASDTVKVRARWGVEGVVLRLK